jgi:hypothetical protein
MFSDEAGPECKCGTVTVRRTVKKDGPTKGRRFWSCARWPNGCGFFEFCQEVPASVASTPPRGASAAIANSPAAATVTPESHSAKRKRPALEGFASYLPDWNKARLLQNMMSAGMNSEQRLIGDRDNDGFEVVVAWEIVNETRRAKYDAALERERAKVQDAPGHDLSLHLPAQMEAVMDELGGGRLAREAGEVLLLHGTASENLYSILFQGLDPAVASNGNFGRGVYFAENVSVCLGFHFVR